MYPSLISYDDYVLVRDFESFYACWTMENDNHCSVLASEPRVSSNSLPLFRSLTSLVSSRISRIGDRDGLRLRSGLRGLASR